MLKRLLLIAALGAALVACSPSGGSSGEPSIDTPTEAVPSMDASPSMEASPSAS
jgi:hypothetical protein